MEKPIEIKVKLNEDSDKTMIGFEENMKREENGESDKKRFVKIHKIQGDDFNIEFLGVDENRCEIYKGEKNS